VLAVAVEHDGVSEKPLDFGDLILEIHSILLLEFGLSFRSYEKADRAVKISVSNSAH